MTNYIRRDKFHSASFYYERRGLLANIDNQAKVHDVPARLSVHVRTQTRYAHAGLEKYIDSIGCLLSNGIGQMVYKLYDLTADEIVIVEGKSRNYVGNKMAD